MSRLASRTPQRDFSGRQHFPGTHGNRFDVLLRMVDVIQALPGPVFAGLLLLLAALPGMARLSWVHWLVIAVFFYVDWALLEALPRYHKSYGPAKTQALLLAFMRLPPALIPLPYTIPLQALGTALVVYGFWVEPHRVRLTRQTLTTTKLRPGPPLRVLQMGDLHSEIGSTDRERQVLELVRAAAPDVILFSGDFINLSYLRDPRAWKVARSVLRELRAPLGVYVVAGSPAVDLEDVVPRLVDDLPNLRWLRDEVVRLDHAGQPVDVVGLTCTHKPFVDGPRLLEVLGHTPPPTFTLLLYHTPDLAPQADGAGVDLQLSGHTHGGQVRLPGFGALFAGSLYGKRYEMGRLHEGQLTLYVARGIGMEGRGAPRVRFLCPPEIVLWEISGAPAPA